jgi:hypothetical protein
VPETELEGNRHDQPHQADADSLTRGLDPQVVAQHPHVNPDQDASRQGRDLVRGQLADVPLVSDLADRGVGERDDEHGEPGY